MDAALVHTQHAPAREVVRDANGKIIGLIERQRHTQKLIARDARGLVVGTYDERARLTRDARGRIVGNNQSSSGTALARALNAGPPRPFRTRLGRLAASNFLVDCAGARPHRAGVRRIPTA